MTEPAAKLSKTTRKRGIALFIVILITSAWALFEYRQSAQLSTLLAAANEQNKQLHQQVTILQQQLADTKRQANSFAQNRLPISLIYRPAPSGNGLITFFKNNSMSPIEVAVVLSSPTTGRRRESNFVIPANSHQSIGEVEGWAFAPGQHIKLTTSQYGSVDYVVPEQ